MAISSVFEHGEREAWRTRLVEAADAFSQSSTAMVSALALARLDLYGGNAVDPKLLEEIHTGLTDTVQKRMHVALLFGGSVADEAAQDAANGVVEAWNELRQALDLEGEERDDALRRMKEAGDAADEGHTRFLEAVHIEVLPRAASKPATHITASPG